MNTRYIIGIVQLLPAVVQLLLDVDLGNVTDVVKT